ncbi:wax ester/triacylglycerol synthase domain-containing protein [Gordonia crocea]|uniref:diacylglycerol O-acyltransferase n=1 Tax=Gordonia crocea TaxID=589162 RepID=A0A7I9V2U7_9ACTN|nr:wax ester/triacylglycerol synthase domain-containing protein [Gordonia crocea]GED99501.1 diacylglycerol O-acyltransferase [Gordonia crocea]
MVNRLTPREAMYYFLDEGSSTVHVGALIIVDPTADGAEPGLDYQSLVSLIEGRIQLAPRYRQLVKPVVLGLARPVWVDDPDFDINFHVRRAGLPRPGATEQLQDLVGRILSRPLDPQRPLWEMYLIEGLADGAMAILTKTHRCVLGPDSPELSGLLLDAEPEFGEPAEDIWLPTRAPSQAQLAVDAIAEGLARPGELVESIVGNGPVGGLRDLVTSTASRATEAISQVTNSAPPSRLNQATTSTRSFAVASIPVAEAARVAEQYRCGQRDVELAVVTGVLRRWMLSFTDTLGAGATVRVVLPIGSRPADDEADSGTGRPRDGWFGEDGPGFVTDLPVGEANPTVVLAQVAGLATRNAQSASRQTTRVSPLLPDLGVVPFGDAAARFFTSWNRHTYNLPIAVVATPIGQRWVRGVPVRELFGIPALLANRALAIAVMTYADHIEFAYLGDRGVMSDLPALVDYTHDAFDEITDAEGGR